MTTHFNGRRPGRAHYSKPFITFFRARLLLFPLLALSLLCWNPSYGQSQVPKGPYTFKKGDPNGIGKWYMG
ncbi:MAG: hypothetical protein WBV75_08175, partial [Robiginitalea sp.]